MSSDSAMRIAEEVCAKHGVDLSAITSKTRMRVLHKARSELFYRCRNEISPRPTNAWIGGLFNASVSSVSKGIKNFTPDPSIRFSRHDAKAAGLKRYFTGKPCPKGHVSERMVSSGSCYECTREWKRRNPDAVRRIDRAYKKTPKMKAWAKAYVAKPKVALTYRMRSRMAAALKGISVSKSWRDLIDYSVDDLKHHLEKQFTKGMTWENMGEWHIDHIIPVRLFDVKQEGDEEFRACWALSNLRPIWGRENVRKSGKRLHLI